MKSNFSRSFVWVILLIMISMISSSSQSAQQPDLTDNLVRYLGLYVFNYPRGKPPMFEKFRWIRISQFPDQDEDDPKTDSAGYTAIDGYVETIDDERFTFKKGLLKKNREGNYENFEFETEKVNGVSYTFTGDFLKKSINEGGEYTRLRGSLLKYKNGQLVANVVTAPFSKYTAH